jgi:TPR repeat protein
LFSYITNAYVGDKKRDKYKIEELYRTGLNYYRNNEYENSLSFFEIAAECQHADAQYVLGIMYSHINKGVQQDYQAALDWFLKAAENGSVKARYRIALCCRDGLGMAQDYRQALVWFTRAAENGHVESQYCTGMLYSVGYLNEIEQNHNMAYLWFKIAAENDHVLAQYMMGMSFFQGHGVDRDYAKAMVWYQRVADRDKTGGAYNNIGHMLEKGLGVPRDNKMAMSYYLKVSCLNNNMAQLNIGQMLELGYGVKQDLIEAMNWYTKAAEAGNPTAQFRLGKMYLRGKPLYDFELALTWFERAVENGNTEALLYMDEAKRASISMACSLRTETSTTSDFFFDEPTVTKEDYEQLKREYQRAQEKAEQAERDAKVKEKKMAILIAQLEIQKSYMQSLIDSASTISSSSLKSPSSIDSKSCLDQTLSDELPVIEKLNSTFSLDFLKEYGGGITMLNNNSSIIYDQKNEIC